jgi:hypothetical protein
MKLIDRWLASGDDRTLSEFVADVRRANWAIRAQRKTWPLLMGIQSMQAAGAAPHASYGPQMGQPHGMGSLFGGALGGFQF